MWFTFIPVYFIYHLLTPKFISNVLITGFFLSAFLLLHADLIKICKNDTFHILPKTNFGVIKGNNHPCVFCKRQITWNKEEFRDTLHGYVSDFASSGPTCIGLSPPFKYAQLGLRQKSRQKVNFDVVIGENYVILWHLENLSSTCSCFYFISVIFDFLIQDPDILECDDHEKKKKV